MSLADVLEKAYRFNRDRTLDLLSQIEEQPDAQAALSWRPGPGRAHIGWHLMHIGITEEIFATERLAPEKAGVWTELWPRFRGGSTPDDDVPTPAMIREVFSASRARLLETLADYPDDRLQEIPPPLAQRGLTVETVLYIISWHEAHHQGQAHAVFNLYKADQQ